MKRGLETEVDSETDVVQEPSPKRVTLSDQARITERIMQGESLFFTGAAGTGKTHLIKNVVEMLCARHGEDHVYVTAPTGIAACQIEGVTIHSFAGLPPVDNPTVKFIVETTMKRTPIVLRWRQTKVLIIDECSMVDPIVFDGLDAAARKARDKPHKPFGGIQVILCGDFLQLKPVIKPPSKLGQVASISDSSSDSDSDIAKEEKYRPTYLFESKAWKEMIGTTHIYELREVFRQKDPEFLSALAELRLGTLGRKSRDFFKKCSNTTFPPETEAVHIYTTRARAALVNAERLKCLPGPTMTYAAVDFPEPQVETSSKYWAKKKKPQTLGANADSSQWMAPDLLELRVGAQVMLIRNLVSGVLVNGTTGIVVGFTESVNGSGGMPIVTFTSMAGVKHTMTMSKHTWERKMGRKVVAKRTQIPLILSWAITAHKSQGMTIDRVVACLDGTFEPGQSYVTISRVRTPEGLKISGNIGRMLPPDPLVVQFYEDSGLTLTSSNQ